MAIAQCSTNIQRKALALAAYSDRWARGTARIRNGTIVAVNAFASDSEPGRVVHLTRVDGAGCTCKGAQLSRSGVCYHMLACQIVTMRVREAFGQPTPTTIDSAAYENGGLVDAF